LVPESQNLSRQGCTRAKGSHQGAEEQYDQGEHPGNIAERTESFERAPALLQTSAAGRDAALPDVAEAEDFA